MSIFDQLRKDRDHKEAYIEGANCSTCKKLNPAIEGVVKIHCMIAGQDPLLTEKYICKHYGEDRYVLTTHGNDIIICDTKNDWSCVAVIYKKELAGKILGRLNR